MKPIPFEKVSAEEARAALDARENVIEAKNTDEEKRRPHNPYDLELQETTFKWLVSLPREVQPRQLAMQFPRIANNLALLWGDKSVCEKFLDGLMIDNRRGRQGFPLQVAKEILALKLHLEPQPSNQSLDGSLDPYDGTR